MSLDFTVAVPTYNGAERLPVLLEKLRSQITSDSISWEVLIVDNNSHDNTAQVVQSYQENWLQPFPLRYCFEPEQGLAAARQRAVQEAKGELVGFLDDDNLPAPDWVNAAFAFGKNHPNAGAYGGKIKGVFEIEPPEELKKMLFYLAIVDRGSQPIEYQPRKNGVPPGAGLVVRKQVWLNHVPPRLSLAGRVGTALLSGEDFEVLLYIHQKGWEIWYNPEMQIEHMISAQRLQKDYFLNLMRGVGLCRHHLRMLTLQWWQKPFVFLMYLVNDFRKAGLHFISHRGVMEGDIVAACEMERLWGTLISPFYLWKVKIDKLVNGMRA